MDHVREDYNGHKILLFVLSIGVIVSVFIISFVLDQTKEFYRSHRRAVWALIGGATTASLIYSILDEDEKEPIKRP